LSNARAASGSKYADASSGAPLARGLGRHVAAMRLEQIADAPLDLVVEAADVVDEREHAAGPQHAVDLGQRARPVEPVKRLRDRDGVRARSGQRDRLGRAVEHLDPARRDHRAHLRDRLDRDDLEAARGEQARELPRPGRQVDEARPAELRREPIDGLVRIARPATLVGVRGPGEADRRGGMDFARHRGESGG